MDRIMDKNLQVRLLLAVGAFLTCWQAAGFALDFKVVMSAVVAGFFGFAKPADQPVKHLLYDEDDDL